jgi:hypothetical protein
MNPNHPEATEDGSLLVVNTKNLSASEVVAKKEELECRLALAYQQCTLFVRLKLFDRATEISDQATLLHDELCELYRREEMKND